MGTILDRLADLEKTPRARAYTAEEYNLEGYRAWIAQMGDPWRDSPWIHLAGTKGKGSTAAMVEALLLAGGFRTGLYTSPHLTHYGERFRFNGEAWTLAEFGDALATMEPLLDDERRADLAATHTQRTVFEVLTALAFHAFRDAGTEAGILEVGLGGRLDCTNVVTPEVTVVAPLGMDHTAILGDSIEKIASEKAGILKPDVPVVLFEAQNDMQARGRAVVEKKAHDVGAPVLRPHTVESLGPEHFGERVAFDWDGERIEARLPLGGLHQVRNLGMALAAAGEFARRRGRPLSAEAVRKGIANVRWPGRCEVLAGPPVLVLDGAHCPTSARALGETLRRGTEGLPGPRTLLWAMQGDKDAASFLRALIEATGDGFFARVDAARAPGARGAAPEELVRLAEAEGLRGRAHESIEAAVQSARHDGMGAIVATGSLYHLSPVREAFLKTGLSPADTKG